MSPVVVTAERMHLWQENPVPTRVTISSSFRSAGWLADLILEPLGERWLVECSCGWESAGHVSFAAASDAADAHYSAPTREEARGAGRYIGEVLRGVGAGPTSSFMGGV